VAYDAVQDAYTAMLIAWSDRRGRSAVDNRSYATRIAINRVIDHYRRCSRLVELDEEHEPFSDDPAFEEVLDEMCVYRAVLRFLDCQPPRRRAVAFLRFQEGYEYAEIAAILDIAESTVRTHVERMRDLFKPFVDQIMKTDQGGEQS
jgi:RNA polymerase sigma factor (sigma-70 family)